MSGASRVKHLHWPSSYAAKRESAPRILSWLELLV